MSTLLTFTTVVGLIITTALLSSIITAALPRVPKWWSAFKSRIKRKKHTIEDNNIEVIVNQVNDLQTQVDNLAERLATRDTNRKSNIRRDVREYLEELKNG